MGLEPSLLKRLRVEARRRGVSVKELLCTLLRRGLEEKPVPKRFRVRSYGMGQASFPIDKALQFAADLEDAEVIRKLRQRK